MFSKFDIYLPQGWFTLVKDTDGIGCLGCDLWICRENGGIFDYPVCIEFADSLFLDDLLHYVLKKKGSY